MIHVALARALQLDEAEQAHLFDLALGRALYVPLYDDPVRPANAARLHRTGSKNLHHPVAGDLDLTYEAFELRSDPELTMLVHTAEPDGPTAQALDFLASWATTQHSAEVDESSPRQGGERKSFRPAVGHHVIPNEVAATSWTRTRSR